jgi:putative transferase (TIGR04331 family)
MKSPRLGRWRTILHDARYAPGEAIGNARTAYLLRTPFPTARSIITGFHYNHVIARLVDQPASAGFQGLRGGKSHASPLDLAARQALDQITKGIACPLVRMALQWLPSQYLEEFAGSYESVPITEPGSKQFHGAVLPNFRARMIIARYVEEGSKLSLYQHAASYGELRDHVLHKAESEFANRFCTWGWKCRERDVPYLALRIMKPPALMFRNMRGAKTWLYIIMRQPLIRTIETTYAVQRRFFGTLSHQLASKVVVRPHVSKGGLAERQIAKEVRSRLQGVDDGSSRMVDLVKGAEIVILDNFPTTAFMECLVGNVPVVAIIPEGTLFTETATEFYDEFFRLGLLQRSPEDAAAFLNQLHPGSWWKGVTKLDCLGEYLNTFCNMDIAARRAASN